MLNSGCGRRPLPGTAGHRDPETDPGPVNDAGRHAQADGLPRGEVADAAAVGAPFAPHFAAPAAAGAGSAHRHVEPDDCSPKRFLRGHDDVRAGVGTGRVAEE